MEQRSLDKAKIIDKIKLFEKTGEIVYTNFLDPAEIIELDSLYSKYPHFLYGGFDEAERKMLAIGSYEIIDEIPIAIIEIVSSKKLNHRDVLGSVLGTGIKRDVVGDIIIKENIANVFVTRDISRYLIQNLDKIGREKVKVRLITNDEKLEFEINKKEIKTTIKSLRLDSAIAACFGLSREVSSELVKNAKVNLNYKEVLNPSKPIKEGDLISVRGFGRFELKEVLGETRKDRIRIILDLYGK